MDTRDDSTSEDGVDTTHLPLPSQVTEPFEAVLAVPGQQTTLGGDSVQSSTQGFGVVLPVPKGPASSRVSSNLQPGVVLKGYTLSETLSETPWAVLYLASHYRYGECQVEVLSPGSDRVHGQDFLLDARLRTTLEDPVCPRVHELGSTPRSWAAKEQISAPTLRQSLRREEVSPKTGGRLVLDVARGLEQLHAKRISHGRLTPEVILVTPTRARVTGFGHPPTFTATGAVTPYLGGPSLGPALYAAPELLRGEPRNAAADIYALGCVLFETLYGRPPYQGTPQAIRAMVLDPERSPLPELGDDLTGRLGQIAQRCMEAEPGRRYSSAQELVGALEQVLASHNPTSAPFWIWGLAIALVVVVLAGAVAVALT